MFSKILLKTKIGSKKSYILYITANGGSIENINVRLKLTKRNFLEFFGKTELAVYRNSIRSTSNLVWMTYDAICFRLATRSCVWYNTRLLCHRLKFVSLKKSDHILHTHDGHFSTLMFQLFRIRNLTRSLSRALILGLKSKSVQKD